MTIEEKAKEHSKNNLCKKCSCVSPSETTCPRPEICKYISNDVQTFIAGVKEATRWIPVEESIPGKDGQYLVKHNTHIMLLWFNTFHKCWDDADGDDCYCDINQVSHWRPIEFE